MLADAYMIFLKLSLRKKRLCFKKSRKNMKQGQASTLLKDMEHLCSMVDGQEKKNMKKALEYFSTRSNELAYSHVVTPRSGTSTTIHL